MMTHDKDSDESGLPSRKRECVLHVRVYLYVRVLMSGRPRCMIGWQLLRW